MSGMADQHDADQRRSSLLWVLVFSLGVVIRADSLLLDIPAAWFLFIAMGKLKQLLDLPASPASSPLLSPFLLPVETLWYRGGQGRRKEKGRDGKGNRQRKGGRQKLKSKLPRLCWCWVLQPTSSPCPHPPACKWCVMAQLCQHPGLAGLQAPKALSGYHYPHSVALITCRFFLLLWPIPQTCTQVPLCSPPAQRSVPPNCHLLQSPLH